MFLVYVYDSTLIFLIRMLFYMVEFWINYGWIWILKLFIWLNFEYVMHPSFGSNIVIFPTLHVKDMFHSFNNLTILKSKS